MEFRGRIKIKLEVNKTYVDFLGEVIKIEAEEDSKANGEEYRFKASNGWYYNKDGYSVSGVYSIVREHHKYETIFRCLKCNRRFIENNIFMGKFYCIGCGTYVYEEK